MILDKAATKKLAERIVKMASAKDVLVSLRGGQEANTRFANNEITSCGDVSDVNVTVRVAFGNRHAAASTNQTDDASLRATVDRAEEMAHLAPEDPEHMPPLPVQKTLDVAARDPKMGGFDAVARQKGVEACLGPARDGKLVAAGFFSSRDGWEAVASSAGAFGHHAATDAEFSSTVRTVDGTGSGWALASSWRVGDVDWAAVGRRAVDKAQRSAQPRALPPGRYTVILEPEAVAGLVDPIRFGLSAREADEGRSFFSKPGGGNRLGETLFSDKVTLVSDPHDALVPARPFDGDGLALRPTTWVDKGVLRALVTDRYWAKKEGRDATGSPTNLIMKGGDTRSTLADMIKSTDKGILVTRFWYIRFVDPQTLLLTGLTRDGTFWIEKGEIAYPVNNFRFNESPAAMFANAESLGAPQRTGAGVAVPPIKAHDFTMASVSAAV